jgi:hypothetical protein
MVAPDDPVFRGWILLADAATLQHLVQLFCPLVWQVLLDQPAHMHSLAIEPDVDALPPCLIHPDRVTELTALLADMSGQQEVHGLQLTMSGHHELVSALGPVGLRKELLQVAGAASSDGTCLKGWYSQARRMFLQGWGAPACCKPKGFKPAAAAWALQECVQQRVRFACLHVAARNLLCVGLEQ